MNAQFVKLYYGYMLYSYPTFPAVVAQVREGWVPSYFPIVTMWGFTLWFSLRVKIGTSILDDYTINLDKSWNKSNKTILDSTKHHNTCNWGHIEWIGQVQLIQGKCFSMLFWVIAKTAPWQNVTERKQHSLVKMSPCL